MISTVARVHYEIPDDLHRQAKAAAAMQGVTLRQFVIEALREAVRQIDRAELADADEQERP
jgi:predicted HicB family RNase H-like nuclease